MNIATERMNDVIMKGHGYTNVNMTLVTMEIDPMVQLVPLREYPDIQVRQVSAELMQVAHGELQALHDTF
jgi:hypothetical protein